MSTRIQWATKVWNPTTGCDKISPGCKYCYAEKFSKRLQGIEKMKERYKNGFGLTLQPDTLDKPYTWKKPQRVFVNSMSDLFHKDVPLDYIQKVFAVMRDNPKHTFMILTKRDDILLKWDKFIDWPSNVWMGVSVESNGYMYRLKQLSKCGAKVKFVSIEPLIGSISALPLLDGINWVILGGESGAKARTCDAYWFAEIKNYLRIHQPATKIFVKQLGRLLAKQYGLKDPKGGNMDEWPENLAELKIREFPEGRRL